ncbi:MAG: hypothetical protein ACI9MC_003359 [Kiritimatiellia bacterium]|jgi:hypothetical protein
MMHRAGTMATVTRELYEEVAHHKFVFGDNRRVRDAPQEGVRMVPDGEALRNLEADYDKMQDMFFSDPAPPTFDEMVAELAALEAAINALAG